MYEYHTCGAASAVLAFGLDRGVSAGGAGNLSCFVSAGAVGTMNRLSLANSPLAGNAPIIVSVSDLDPLRYAILKAKVDTAATATTSLFVNFWISWRMDGPDPQ